MSDKPTTIKDVLPNQPLIKDSVKSLGNSDSIIGIRPIVCKYNNLITEMVVYKTESEYYALAYDPETTEWRKLDERTASKEVTQQDEKELMEMLQDWRQENVVPFLAENNLIPTKTLQ